MSSRKCKNCQPKSAARKMARNNFIEWKSISDSVVNQWKTKLHEFNCIVHLDREEYNGIERIYTISENIQNTRNKMLFVEQMLLANKTKVWNLQFCVSEKSENMHKYFQSVPFFIFFQVYHHRLSLTFEIIVIW